MDVVVGRAYGGVEDFLPVRNFLAELRGLLPPGQTWDVRRWDGSNCHTMEIGLDAERTNRTHIWEHERRIVAAALTEGGRAIHPHVHPEWVHLFDDVVAWSEEAGRIAGDDSAFLLVWDQDAVARRVVSERSYSVTTTSEYFRTARFGAWPIPEPAIVDGYELRSVRNDPTDHQRVADIVNAAFGRTMHVEEDHRALVQNSPSYRADLDLAAIAPDGSFAAYGAVNVDETNSIGTFEPVCTHPDHVQRGLAKALMLEGMRRARDAGLTQIEVATGEMGPANALYDSLPFTLRYHGTMWRKTL